MFDNFIIIPGLLDNVYQVSEQDYWQVELLSSSCEIQCTLLINLKKIYRLCGSPVLYTSSENYEPDY